MGFQIHGSKMTSTALLPQDRTRRIGVLVARNQRRTMLSPFFAKCDGLLVVDCDARTREYRTNAERTGESICNAILASGITRLICGFVAEPDCIRLSASGIDIRIGSCARPVTALIRMFETLPAA